MNLESADDALLATAERVASLLSVMVEVRMMPHSRVTQAAAWMTDARGQRVTGFGAAIDSDRARALAIIECAERWALAFPDGEIVTGSWRDLSDVAVDPRALGLYAEHQYPLPGVSRFDESAPLEWVHVQDIAGRAALLPQEVVYPREPLCRDPLVVETSSGSAGGLTLASALERGMREVIERDAFMLAWHRRGRTHVTGELPDDIAAEIGRLGEAGWITAVLRIEQDIALPCVLMVAVQGSRYSHGLGCSPDPDDAARRALGELVCGLRADGEQRALLCVALSDIQTPDDHRALYDGGFLHSELRAFLGRAVASDPSTFGAAADSATAALSKAGYRVLYREVGAPAVREAGLRLVRVVVPGLVPLSFGWGRLRLGLDRLRGNAGVLVTLPHFLD